MAHMNPVQFSVINLKLPSYSCAWPTQNCTASKREVRNEVRMKAMHESRYCQVEETDKLVLVSFNKTGLSAKSHKQTLSTVSNEVSINAGAKFGRNIAGLMRATRQ